MAQRMCSVVEDGIPCGRPNHAWLLCTKHYQRWKNHGDPLAGRTFHGAPRQWLAKVIERAKSTSECIIDWPFCKDKKGYPRMNATGTAGMAYHVLMEMLGRHRPLPPNDKVRHLCGNGHLACLHTDHIVWGSTAENAADKVRHGRSNRGKSIPTQRKLTASDVRAIRASTDSAEALAGIYGVTASNIRIVRRGLTWRHLL